MFSWPQRLFTHVPPSLTDPIEEEIDSSTSRNSVPLANASNGVYYGVEALEPMIAAAKASAALKDESSRWDTFPIFLKATAGMRIVPPLQRQLIIDNARALLSQSGFKFDPSHIRVISGEEEGVFGWITANYLTGQLGFNNGTSFGALDLGGASTQITYQPQEDPIANVFNVQLGSALNQDVYTHSYLYFGQNEALRRMAQAAVDAAVRAGAQPGATVQYPCFATGYSEPFTANYGEGATYTLQGSSNYDGCHELAKGEMQCVMASPFCTP